MWLVHDLRSRRGIGDGLNTVCGGRVNREGGVLTPELGLGNVKASAMAAGGFKTVGVGVVGPGLERPDDTSNGVDAPDRSALLYWMILRMFVGSLLDVIMVVTPAAMAISAAISFVSIPPVPRLEPNVVVLTGETHGQSVYS